MPNCPCCKKYFSKKQPTIDHINLLHSSELADKDMTAGQLLYASTHNGDYHGRCIVCYKPTQWNPNTLKPYRLCGDPKCNATIKAQYDKNRDAKLHMSQSELMSDMQHQRDMLGKRHISGKYKFDDGKEVEYTGKLELSFLQFCNKILGLKSHEVLPSPECFTYFDPKDGKTHIYDPDYYLIEYNLIVEVKDANNQNPAFLEETRYKVALKDDAMKKQSKYNYIRISGTNYGPLLEILYKITHAEDRKQPDRKNIIMISESVHGRIANTKEDHNVYLIIGRYLDNTPKFIALDTGVKHWYISDIEDKTLHVLKDIFLTGDTDNDYMCHYYEYTGDRTAIDSALGNIKTSAINGTTTEWDILEILKNSHIYFSDNEISNNNQKKSDFVFKSASFVKREPKEDS